jgi:hypothetical protein
MMGSRLPRLALGSALALAVLIAFAAESRAQCPPGWELVGETEDEYLCSPIEAAGPSAEEMAARRSRAIQAWRSLMAGYRDLTDPDAEWRVTWQAWWNDPMHQAWVGDALIIASLPLLAADALAVGEGLLKGGTARKAVQRSLAKPPKWTNAVNRAAISRFEEVWPATEYYRFPTHVRSDGPPKIPKWLFVENPYKQAYPGGRTWFWADATSVRIRRTEALDKELKWLLTGEGRY